MANSKFKKKMKVAFNYVWELIKMALPAFFMYLCAGSVALMLNIKFEKEEFIWKNNQGLTITWIVICAVVACAYNGVIAWANGGSHYEMLASGNMKRASVSYGDEFKISSHKVWKEYRVWKGFVVGAICALPVLIFGIAFGINQAKVAQGLTDKTMGLLELGGIMSAGWAIMPFYYANALGGNCSYFLSLLFILLPVAINGAFYIIGAYARRNKAIRQQELADKAREAEMNKPKKINYGGLPGTKPKKRK